MKEIKSSVVFFFGRFAIILEHMTCTNTIFEESVTHLHLLDWVEFRGQKEDLVTRGGVLRDCLSDGIEERSSILVLVTCHEDLESLHSVNEQT